MRLPLRSGTLSLEMDNCFRLRSCLHHCRIDSSYVFLDVLDGRYFLLRGNSASSFDRYLDGVHSSSDISLLLQSRILSDEHETNISAPITTFHHQDCSEPQKSLLFEVAFEPPIYLTVQSMVAQYNARRILRHKSFFDVIRYASELKVADVNEDDTTYLPFVAAMARTSRYISAKEQCLPRALALRKILARNKLNSKLIFGVKLPFSAHCWLQRGSTVLTDTVDQVVSYKPILVI